MSTPAIAAGNAALRDGAWQAAADAFGSAIDSDQAAEALLGLGQSLWWLGDMSGAITHLEKAYASFRGRPDPLWAAACALRLGFHHRAHLANVEAADGWLARASRLIDDHALEPLRGEHLLMKAYITEDPRAGEAWAREAVALGRSGRDADLEVCAMAQLGASLVAQGRVADGLPLLGEAMAACLGGETTSLETLVFANCQTMVACARSADFARAVEWVRAAERLAVTRAVPFLHAECRAVYASVLFATGEWEALEETARTALAFPHGQVPAFRSAVLATLAELRLAQGRIEDAERLLADAGGDPAGVAAHAQVQLRRGQPAAAATTVQRRLDLIGQGTLESVRLIELRGEADLARGDSAGAVAQGRVLFDLGTRHGCRIALARGLRLEGNGLASSDVPAACRLLDRAALTFHDLGMPYECARTRHAIAVLLHVRDRQAAIAEARQALAAFERLGAGEDADRVASFLRETGVSAGRAGPRRQATLTRREREVLRLVGEGLPNPAIAARLFISRRTVEHHVANILAKLGLNNRAQAAAEAARHPDGD